MYFPIGWPKLVDTAIIGAGAGPATTTTIRQICCDRVKILLAVLSDDFLGIWYTKPLVPIAYQRRTPKSLEKEGSNKLLAWKPDSGMIVVATDTGYLKFYSLEVIESQKGVYNQVDPPLQNLRRDSAELFIKEIIPSLLLKPAYTVALYVEVNSIACVSAYQIMVATKSEKIFKIKWNGAEERDYTIDLKRTPFSINQQVSYAVPITEANTFVTCLEYSPLVGGFAITLNDGRAAFLTAPSLKFDPNQVQGIWAPTIEDATCCSVNHKFRLIAFGQKNSQASVYTIEESVGGLELSHKLVLSPKDFPGLPGPVNDMKWTPDGCAIALSWANGGISVWSTFGAMLMCSLGWDYGVHTDLTKHNPLNITQMEWSTEGYQLFLLQKSNPQDMSIENGNVESDHSSAGSGEETRATIDILQLDFVKSTLSVNPCMATHSHILLQGDDKLYISQGNSLEKIYLSSKGFVPGNQTNDLGINNLWKGDDSFEIGKQMNVTSMLGESKHWTVVQLPVAYAATNWPIRYSAIDKDGVNVAVAGRTGLAHYSVTNRKWKLFGNETQEKDFVVTGGLLWWNDFIVMGCFSLVDLCDEIRVYPKECKLDNRFGHRTEVKAPVMLINVFKNQLVVLSADGIVSTFSMTITGNTTVDIRYLYQVDIRNICMHSACVVSINVTNLKHETASKTAAQAASSSETIVLNVSGRILMVIRESNSNPVIPLNSTCLASCVECVWLSTSERSHMKESLWLFCGIHGMRVWLPVLPCEDDVQRTYRHTFMSKRIMLSFSLKVYPLAILFEDVMIVGVENDTVLYTSDSNSHFSIPFSILERKSQVYLHQILRQLIRRNLGYNAWEIARCCTNLPYFPHSLELLLHEVLEDEATSKEPIPDALLPSVLEFIQEFPVYLQTIVQCARKTEIALWHYLFAAAGKPKELFQQCLSVNQLETAASYLIILQNLEPSAVSRQYATLLLDTALENKKWDLAKDLVRFLRAIDPNDVESPRNSFTMSSKFGYPQLSQLISPDAEDLSLILGTMTRGRSFSTTVTPKAQSQNTQQPTQGAKDKTTTALNSGEVQRRKKSMPNTTKEKNSSSAEDFFIEVILQRHARRLLQERKVEDLGKMSAALDFHLVGWLAREHDRAARIEDFVAVLKQLHADLDWPKPNTELTMDELEVKGQQESPCLSLDCSTKVNNIGAIDSGYSSLPNSIDLNLTNPSDVAKYNLPRTNSISNTIPLALPCINEEYSVAKIDNKTVASSKPTDLNSVCSNETSIFSTDIPLSASTEMYYTVPSIEYRKRRERLVPHKLEVKIRYLLQIFTEANCLEYSLVLSILLLDAASISRITNTAIRSGSLQACRQIRNGLKDITRWSFHECFGYRSFMMKLQPQINLLDQFVIQQESIPALEPEMQPTVSNESTDRPLEARTPTSSSIHLDVENANRNDKCAVQSNDSRVYSETKTSVHPKLSKSASLDESLLSGNRHDEENEKGMNCVVM